MKRKILLFLVVMFIMGFIAYLESQKAEPYVLGNVTSVQTRDSQIAQEKQVQYQKAPELAGISGYLNTNDTITIAQFLDQDKIVLIDFWTYTCINCIRTLPYLASWHDKYADKGLVIIGVHTPEFEFEKKKENVQMALEKYNIKYPVVQDNDYGTWQAFNNRYWPRKYLIDSDGFIRYDHAGEGGYEEAEQMIQTLLAENGLNISTSLTQETPTQRGGAITPELYAGFQNALPRGQSLGNKEGFRQGEKFMYVVPKQIPQDKITLSGRWTSNPEELVAGEQAELLLNFTAQEVNMVVQPDGDLSRIDVFLDGGPLPANFAGKDISFTKNAAIVSVNEPRLYGIIKGEYGNHKLTLKMKAGLKVSAFTFG